VGIVFCGVGLIYIYKLHGVICHKTRISVIVLVEEFIAGLRVKVKLLASACW